jgi:GTPase Era involved in 16S rRNA processing
MPTKIMKKVFASIPDNCLVLTIIGPQSSGKSTLLNFLFGCDFATSEGRCTRGVYGTYFRFNGSYSNAFDGIFVIDTEGLFALTNETDEKFEDRENFDSKLVLFCLAVSDFVIINVRGNLDQNT